MDASPPPVTMKPGPLTSLLLVPRDPIHWDRVEGRSYGVDVCPPGTNEPVMTVFGTSPEEAQSRMREVLRGLASIRRAVR